MSARSDLINAAATVLSNPTPTPAPSDAVESGKPPTETGLMGAVAADLQHEPEADATRVTEEEAEGTEPAEGTTEATAEPEKAPEPAKPEPEKPAKPKFDAKGYANQHAALTRRMKAVEAAERKVTEIIGLKEAEFMSREEKIAALEKLDELDEMALIKLAAERRGKSANDILRAALWQQAGYKQEQKTEGQDDTAELDPKILKLIKASEDKLKAFEDEVKAARKEASEAKEKLTERERRELEYEDNAILHTIAQTALNLVNEKADKFPYIAAEKPEKIVEKYLEVANEQARLGYDPDPEAILEHLDVLHEQEFNSRYERLQPHLSKTKSAPEATTAAPPPAPPVSKSPESLQKSSSGPKAITNALTAQTGPGTSGKRLRDRDLINDAGDFLKSKGF